jgi:hypothetical protein
MKWGLELVTMRRSLEFSQSDSAICMSAEDAVLCGQRLLAGPAASAHSLIQRQLQTRSSVFTVVVECGFTLVDKQLCLLPQHSQAKSVCPYRIAKTPIAGDWH